MVLLRLKEFKMLIVPKFDIGSYEPKLVGDGFHGVVIRISEDLVAKLSFAKSNREAKRDAKHEYEIARALYDHGVSVPKPEGVFRLDKDIKSCFGTKSLTASRIPSRGYGFVMEYVPGVLLSNEWYRVHPNYWEPLYEKLGKEIKKAQEIAFPDDFGSHNFLVHENKLDGFIIDFYEWELK